MKNKVNKVHSFTKLEGRYNLEILRAVAKVKSRYQKIYGLIDIKEKNTKLVN
jgi:hypothetical protein